MFIVVSRHQAAVRFCLDHLAARLDGRVEEVNDDSAVIVYPTPPSCEEEAAWNCGETIYRVPLYRDTVGPNEVQGRTVYGNLPLHLAALANEVRVVEFAGSPPRGAEYSAEDMKAAGARIGFYAVTKIKD